MLQSMVHIVTTGRYSFKDLLSHMRTPVKSTHRGSFYISRQPGNLLHFEDQLHNLCHIFRKMPFIGAFAKLRKVTISFMSVRPSASNNSAPSGWIFMKFDIQAFLWNSVEKIQVSLKSDKNNWYFTWRPTDIFNHISLSSSWNEKYFRQKL